MDNAKKLYFDWLCDSVDAGPEVHYRSRYRILHFLFCKPFWYNNPMDQNRLEDAIDMQESFKESNNLYFNQIPSCLEVMVALCIRMGRDIMGTNEPEELSRWFTDMLKGLDLYSITNYDFDPEKVDVLVDLWISGEKMLFKGPEETRNYDIWYQMQYYLNELIERG